MKNKVTESRVQRRKRRKKLKWDNCVKKRKNCFMVLKKHAVIYSLFYYKCFFFYLDIIGLENIVYRTRKYYN